MKILFLVGAYPPKICGIGDYTFKLKIKLNENNIQTKVIDGLNWKTNPFKIYKKINEYKPDIIHIQYPLTGLSAHFLILMCFIKYKIIITAHEFSETHWSRKLSMFIFPLSKVIIWTTNIEMKKFKQYFPIRIPCNHITIPIASNIPFVDSIIYTKREKIIGFFGSIRPAKGLDPFFELIDMLSQDSFYKDFKYIIIGTVFEVYKDYYNKIKEKYSHINIEWKLELDEISVANELSKIKYIYLPFEDGASERRGSLLASIGNGAFVISTAGKYLTTLIHSAIEIAESPNSARKLIENAEKNILLKEKSAFDEIKKYYHWDKITEMNINTYNQILNRKKNIKVIPYCE